MELNDAIQETEIQEISCIIQVGSDIKPTPYSLDVEYRSTYTDG